MNNHDAELQSLEIVFVLKTPISGNQYIAVQLFHQFMIFQLLPPEIEKRLDMIVRKRFYESWIDGGVYYDAHAN